jgi:hypothetical protein
VWQRTVVTLTPCGGSLYKSVGKTRSNSLTKNTCVAFNSSVSLLFYNVHYWTTSAIAQNMYFAPRQKSLFFLLWFLSILLCCRGDRVQSSSCCFHRLLLSLCLFVFGYGSNQQEKGFVCPLSFGFQQTSGCCKSSQKACIEVARKETRCQEAFESWLLVDKMSNLSTRHKDPTHRWHL